MKKNLLFLTIVIMVLPNISFGGDQKLSLKASLFIPSVYGGSWELTIKEHGESGGARFLLTENDRRKRIDAIYTTGKVGLPRNIETTLSKGEVAFMEQIVKDFKFFSINELLMNNMISLHQPTYRIGLCLGEKCHYVKLYDPRNIPKELWSDLDKFKNVWNFLWKFVSDSGFKKSELTL